jgi:hypothetical protein
MIIMNVMIIFEILKKEEDVPMNMKQNINVINSIKNINKKYVLLILLIFF